LFETSYGLRSYGLSSTSKSGWPCCDRRNPAVRTRSVHGAGYDENRYYRRGETGVVRMTEFEVSSAYALAHRTAEHRDDEWRKHFLRCRHLQTSRGYPSRRCLRTVSPNLRGQGDQHLSSRAPPAVRKRLLGLPIHEATVRHWADGITADDELVGRPLAFKLRLHRDGSQVSLKSWRTTLTYVR